ncbi:8-amino-7-oxononanoate synthase [Pukyongia salina]|uniref:8-amino-7-oxononanoate synthase n=1 Tax=Pukyongia salina TaxID=2094025 RepID=A0A2S0HW31_9FLAO|nr:8-amino-7-oxononanoate synthase [Pukyongia salina]AVI50828.1 8-amino-7-oxononanoate synthase [Pukyongia salina]
MDKLPEKLLKKLQKREEGNALRQLNITHGLTDFSSNDYLGFASSKSISDRAYELLNEYGEHLNGSTGSRLLTGNSRLIETAERSIAKIHDSPSALIFNSGYAANLGVISCIPQRGDVILYDELVHASIREGIVLSHAKVTKFAHNDLQDLEQKLNLITREPQRECYVITESVFSMDGDIPDLQALVTLCKNYNCRLILDEAHAIGLTQKGLVVSEGLTNQVFARVVTFGKALGCHGAVVLGSEDLRAYLVNYARSFIYSTALSPHSVATIKAAYEHLDSEIGLENIQKLNSNIAILRSYIEKYNISKQFLPSDSAVQAMLIPGNEKVKAISERLYKDGFDVRPIMSPTVPPTKERLRICLHSFNTEAEIESLIKLLAQITL